MATIGIDFGYSAIRVGIYNDFCKDEVPKAEVLPNDLGDRATPTVIAIDDQTRLVGVDAVTHSALNPHNSVYGIKRIIGRSESDGVFEEHKRRYFFQSRIKNKKLFCSFTNACGDNEERTFEELVAFIFQKIKENAEQELRAITGESKKVDSAVIAVPSFFHHLQREAVLNAAKIIDLKVIRLINDTTAAAVNYACDILDGGNKKMLILDFGASSLELSLIEVNGFKIEVLSTVGTTSLGGVDFDHRLMQLCMQKFIRHENKDISNDRRMLHKLRIECEKAKKTLQQKSDARIKIDLPDGTDLIAHVSRKQFDECCQDLYENVIWYVDKVFDDTNVSKREVNEIVLVGGSSRLKKIEDDLKTKWKLNKRLNVDEAVARGTAIVAYLTKQKERDIELHELTPYRYGFTTRVITKEETKVNMFHTTNEAPINPNCVTVIIDRNFKLPVSGKCLLSIKYPNVNLKNTQSNKIRQYSKTDVAFGSQIENSDDSSNKGRQAMASPCYINVVIGDNSKVFDCIDLLKFKITHEWNRVQNLVLNVTLDIDVNGICKFTAKHFIQTENGYDTNCKLEIEQMHAGLEDEEITLMKTDLKNYNNYIQLENERVACKNELQNELFHLKQSIKNFANSMDKTVLDDVRKKVCNISDWADQNSKASIESLAEQRKLVEEIKLVMEESKRIYKEKVENYKEQLMTAIAKMKTDIESARSLLQENDGYIISEDIKEMNMWMMQNKQPKITEIANKLRELEIIKCKLDAHIERERRIQKEVKNNLLDYIKELDVSPFCMFEHLNIHKKYEDYLKKKTAETTQMIAREDVTTSSILECKKALQSFVSKAKEALEKEEMCRLEAKNEISAAMTKLEKLICGNSEKSSMPLYAEQNIKKLIDESQQWLIQNQFASKEEFIGYANKLNEQHQYIIGEIKKECTRASKMIELRTEALNLVKICNGANKSNLRDDQTNHLITSANNIISWVENKPQASNEEIEEKMSEVHTLKKCRKIMIDDNEKIGDENTSVGIDLGTSYCCLAIFKNSKWEVIDLEIGQSRMPACVVFTEKEILVGSEAKMNMFDKCENAISNIKRLIGRKRSDGTFLTEKKYLNYFIDAYYEKWKVGVKRHSVMTKFSPEQITAMLLMKIKFIAEEYLGKEVKSATFSVPSIFNSAQRRSTRDAALIAGFTDVKLLNDSLAVTLKHVWNKQNPELLLSSASLRMITEPHRLLVLSIGAGFTTFSITQVEGNNVKVINHSGLDFGGDDFDRCLLNHIETKYERKFEAERKMEMLAKCENRKMFLANIDSDAVVLDMLEDHHDYTSVIFNTDFDSECKRLFDEIFSKIIEMIKDVELCEQDINEVLVVGGSSKMICFKKILNNNFAHAKITEFDEESIAVGCAICAAVSQYDLFKRIRFTDICSYEYKAKSKGSEEITLKKRSRLPATADGRIVATVDYQCKYPTTFLEIGDYENLIADPDISPYEVVKKNKTAVKLFLEVDENGIISLFKAKNDKDKEKIPVKFCIGETELARMKVDAKEHRREVLKDQLLAKEKKLLSNCIDHYSNILSDSGGLLMPRHNNQLSDMLSEARILQLRDDCTIANLQTRRSYLESQFKKYFMNKK